VNEFLQIFLSYTINKRKIQKCKYCFIIVTYNETFDLLLITIINNAVLVILSILA